MIRGGLGQLSKCIELHSRTGPTTSQDDYGQPTETYSKYADAFASIRPLGGSEFLQAQQIDARITGKAMIRYDARVSPKDRIIYNDGTTTRTLEINVVINVMERNELLELWYTEIDE